MRRIDVHHHSFTDTLSKELKNTKMGWRTPPENLPWSPEVSLKAMDALGIDCAILSFPALSNGTVSKENREATRQQNELMHRICRDHALKFGFFASLPFLDDISGVIEEINFAFDILHADGISLSSCYGEGENAAYIGDDRYDVIWAALNHRQAVVFLHGAQIPSSTPYPHAFLGIPISEVPNETFKAAAHLVVTGRKRKYSNVKIILAHLGGSTPFLAARVAVLAHHMGCPSSPEEILEDFQSFYYDTALSGYKTNLAAIESFVHPDRILFGSDFPAVSIDMARWYSKNLEDYYTKDPATLRHVMYENALRLFPRLQ